MILAPPFSLKGRAGKTLDATVVLLDDYGARDAKLVYRSMGSGQLTWTQNTGGVVPDIGQEVDLIDGNGVRIFTGTAKRKFIWESGVKARWLITVTDAWEGMVETPLTAAVVDEVGGSTTRPLVVYPTGDLKTSILSLITRMNALGVKFAVGTVTDCFSVQRMTFSKSTGAEALADMMRWIPDAETRVDYSPVGLPTLNVVRRSAMTSVTLALGDAANDTLAIEMEDQPELRPLAVEVFSASRDAQGRIVYGSQLAGDAGAEAKRRQTVVASGPENTAVIPGQTYDNAWIRTFTTPDALLRIVERKVEDYIATWAEDLFIVSTTVTVSGTTVYNADGNIVSVGGAYSTSPIKFYPAGYYGVAFGWDGIQEPPLWLVQELGLIKGEMKGDLYAKNYQYGSPTAAQYKQRADLNSICGGEVYWFASSYYHVVKKFTIPVWLIPSTVTPLYPPTTTTATSQANPVSGSTSTDLAKLVATSSNDPTAYVGQTIEWGSGYSISARIIEYDPTTKIIKLNQAFSGSAKLSSELYRFTSTPTEIISPADFDFVFPPADLATNLFAAQNFLPWRGRAHLGRGTAIIPLPGDKLSVTGGDPSWNTAGALIQSTDIDLRTRNAEIGIGSSPLTAASTLIDQFRSAARDNLAI